MTLEPDWFRQGSDRIFKKTTNRNERSDLFIPVIFLVSCSVRNKGV